MRGALMVTTLIALLIVGFLVIQNMEAQTQQSGNDRVEEIARARQAASQVENQVESVRKSLAQSGLEITPALP